MSTRKLPKRIPKWAKGRIKETRNVYIGRVEDLIYSLKQFPPYAYAEIEEDYGDCYGHDELIVSWYRDHTAEEYHKERKQRQLKAKKSREIKEARDEQHRKEILAEAKRLGIV